jgi:tetratricopeptide (TPR) repeat protein
MGTLTRTLITSGLLLLVTLVTYFPALDGKFIWDDDAHVTAPSLRSLTGLERIWTDPRATQQYYPLTHSVFWLEYKLWGANPVGYHVVNVVLHVAGALLLWRILASLAVPGAWLGAAIFALHPVHVESVAWITELKNTLSGVFYLGALLAYLAFDSPGAPAPVTGRKRAVTAARDWRLYGVALALFVCALLSKTVTASLPAAILLIVWWKEGRVTWRRHVVPLIPFFIVGATLGLTTAWVERHFVGAEGDDFALPWVDRGLIAGRALWFYAGKLCWPANLIFIYPRWSIDRSAWWQYVYPSAALAVVVALWALRGRTGRGALVAALFFGGTLAPALGFFNIYPFIYSFVADHFQYLASLGLITLAAALIAAGLARLGVWQRPAGHAVCAALLLVLAVLSWRQAHFYKDAETLYRDLIARNPGGSLGYVNLSGLYSQQGRNADAVETLSALIAIRPDYAPAYSRLGVHYEAQGRFAEAMAAYRSALAIKPNFAEAHYHLGLAHAAQGRPAEAIAEYQAALAIEPEFIGAHYALGLAHAAQGRPTEAIAEYQAALAIKPDFVKAHQRLAAAYADLGRYPEAIAALKSALAIVPAYPEAYNDLGLLYRKQGMISEAIATYRAAIAIKPDFTAAYNNLGAAYSSQGKDLEAIAAWQRAVGLDPNSAAGRAAQANIEIVRARLGR